jgi:hypothetical protein
MKFLNLLFIIGNVFSFYKTGHEIIGSIVDELLEDSAKNNIYNLLQNNVQNTSSWADSDKVRKNKEYSWSVKLHFLVTDDSPDKGICQINSFKTSERNLFSALTNYTQRLIVNRGDQESLKFLIHFYQDLFEPLHMSGVYRGGNDYPVIFNKRKTSLHQVWDSLIIENTINNSFDNNVIKYTRYLLKLSKNQTPMNSFDYTFWMTTNNKINCENVYKDISMNATLSEKYVTLNSGLFDILLVRAAVNLAYILNQLYR